MPENRESTSPAASTEAARRGRPSTGVSRKEQYRRAKAAQRAGMQQLNLLIPPDMNNALQAAAEDHPKGKAGFAMQVLARHLQSLGLYQLPPDDDDE